MARADKKPARKPSRRDGNGASIPASDFRILFESVPDPCLVLDPELRIVAVNEAYLRVTMTRREEITGLEMFHAFPDNPAEPGATGVRNLRASLNQVLKNKLPDVMPVQKYDIRKPPAEGGEFQERYWSPSNTPVLGRDGEIVYIIHRVQDVTEFVRRTEKKEAYGDLAQEPQQAEAEIFTQAQEIARINLMLKLANEQLAVQNERLGESEQRFASFMLHLPVFAWIKDIHGRYQYANPKVEGIFAARFPDLLGRTDQELFPPEIAKRLRENDLKALVQGSLQTVEVLPRPDGTELRAFVSKFVLPGSDGQPAYFAGVALDITEREQVEDALRLSEARYRVLFEANPTMIVTVDSELTMLSANRACVLQLGYRIEELEGRSVLMLFRAVDRPAVVKLLRSCFRSPNRVFHWEVPKIHKGGGIIWVEETAQAVADLGHKLNILLVCQDITERKRAEEALRESEEKFYKVFDLAPIGITISTLPDGVLLEVNKAGELLSGYQRDEVVGRSVSEFGIWHDPGQRDQLIGEIVSKGEVRDREVSLRDKAGRVFWGLFSGVIIEILGEKHLLALVSDIEERKKVQESLRNSEERFRLLAETVPVMIWETGPDGCCTFLNKPWGEFTGKQPEQELGKIGCWTQGEHPDDLQFCQDTYLSAFRKRQSFTVEFRLRRSDGEYRWMINTGVPRLAPNGELLGYIGTCVDITERKRVGEELQQDKTWLEQKVAERTADLRHTVARLKDEVNERIRIQRALEAETAERHRAQEELHKKEVLLLKQGRLAAMGDMVGNIAHQWRQPLNMLGLLVQELPMTYKHGAFTAAYLDRMVKKMLETINHMSKTIDDFRNFFRPDKEKITFRVAEMVHKTISLLEIGLATQRIKMLVVSADDPVASGYPSEYAQVLLNIIVNARDELVANEVENPIITIEIGTEEGRSLVTITDNAGGIPEEIMDQIFDPYFTTKGPDRGSGVGLYMSKIIIEKNMDGSLTASNVNGGARFTIVV